MLWRWRRRRQQCQRGRQRWGGVDEIMKKDGHGLSPTSSPAPSASAHEDEDGGATCAAASTTRAGDARARALARARARARTCVPARTREPITLVQPRAQRRALDTRSCVPRLVRAQPRRGAEVGDARLPPGQCCLDDDNDDDDDATGHAAATRRRRAARRRRGRSTPASAHASGQRRGASGAEPLRSSASRLSRRSGRLNLNNHFDSARVLFVDPAWPAPC